ncbi:MULTISPECIES: hypothetical protein [unclassified Lactobacillus]|uniref:hypothetical protein n=1 Tax=unclassified Lactobacillus TaxID=2620435 RepID=UPI000EFA4386|nr:MULTISPECIES: hypothetical protein [unclassified Lactobacillus]RMC23699.1 hypothetical protein F5ESL0247_07035 [Lactobacillus sp. ESL0247]RMC27459.1 hypothetical protein F5ESL0246_07035 [Lactobacillus sp. ESL0246]RMC30660.1 hypothetical protein F5ESL0245_07035 [Lactobacillus sp. ESL0245]
MKINLIDLTNKIEQQDYLEDLETIKYAEISKSKTKIKTLASKMVKELGAAIRHDSLGHIALEVTGQRPVTFAIENNIINLPYSDYKKIANFFDENTKQPLNVYFETESDYLNASGFRIDQLATDKELIENEDEVSERLADAVMAKLHQVREYQKNEIPVKSKTVSNKKVSTSKG